MYTREEVQREGSNADHMLVIIDDGVYDITKFRTVHPGGEEILWTWAGRDATGAFYAISHSTRAHRMLDTYKVGTLAGGKPSVYKTS